MPGNVLESSDAAIVNRWLSLFVTEVRNKKGQPYPPSTIHQLLCGLQRIMQQEHNSSFQFFDKTNKEFDGLRAAFDRVCRQLHNEGLATMTKRSGFLTLEEEDLLWKNSAMGIDTPKQLLCAVVVFIMENFALRGGDEH